MIVIYFVFITFIFSNHNVGSGQQRTRSTPASTQSMLNALISRNILLGNIVDTNERSRDNGGRNGEKNKNRI